MKYIVFLSLLLLGNFLTAQVSFVRSVEPEESSQHKFKVDFSFSSGLSIPLGKFKLLTAESNDRSAAGIGGFAQLYTSFRPISRSPWRLGLTIGYMHQPFQAKASAKSFDLPYLNASSWNSYYCLLGLGYSSRGLFLYGIKADFGIMAYHGGDITSGKINNTTLHIRKWKYGLKAVAAVHFQLNLGARINKQLSIFATVSTFYAAALRRGALSTSNHPNNGQQYSRNINPNNEKTVQIENQTTIFVLNCGFGCHYRFFKQKESLHYSINIEENL